MSGRLIEIIKGIIDNTVRKRKIILALSCIVVFVTTYMLILPAITLDLKSASEQGGIDIGAASEEIEENDEEPQEPEEAGEENPPESAADAEDSGSGEEDVKDEKAPEVSSESREKKSGADNAQPQDLSFEGKGFSVTLKDVEGVLPEGTELTAEEILEDDERYGDYYKDALDAYCRETGNDDIEGFDFARFYDISLINGSEKIEPDKGTVNVSISYDKDDKRNKGDNALRVDSKENIHIIHFAEDAESGKVKAELLDSESVGVSVSKDRLEEAAFETDSFSVYAIVNAPEPAQASGWVKVTSLEEIVEHGTEAAGGLYMRQKDGCYFTNTLSRNVGGNANRTGITKTKPYKNSPDEASELGAVPYYFEQTEAPDKFKVYCYADDSKQYLKQSDNSLSFVTDKNNATAFKISAFSGSQDNFRAEGSNNYCWNQQGNYSGVAFAAYNDPNDNNARIQFEYYKELQKDPYGLDGKTYGIAYHDNNVNAAALTDQSQSGSAGRLAGTDLVMKPNVVTNDGILLVSEDTDLTEWTFECIEGDYYYIKTSEGYLTINGGAVTVENEPDPVFSKIKAVPGTDSNSGKWHFTVNGRSLNLPGTSASGFNAATGSGDRTWMNLVEKTNLTEEDFLLYSAKKISVSDTLNVYDGQQVVIYTRVWNDKLKKYEFYVVDHDGSLVKANDTGDGIEWTGSKVNTALWTFVEYKEEGSPTYFYELRNVQYGNYIDPKNGAEGEELLTDSTVGINLNGRRYGENYTTIIAWDEEHYSYSGIKAGDGKIEGCRLNEAEDFYFAVIELHDPGDELSTVNTIDSKQYGITMKMIDFNNGNAGSGPSDTRDAKQKEYFGGDNNNPGLLTTNLPDGKYPESTSITPREGRSLSDLFNEQDGLSEVNHLFIESIYNESGYFEYSSTSNFAHLNDDGTFTVYDQLGNISDYNKPTNQHGQFMPYDNIVAGQYSPFTNETDVVGNELPDLDARKGEKIYGLGTRANVDYHFGMEMEASFTQTANGKDAWGHDIVFEFSGDDDFWFYVDGELVLDLGGVHSAMTGSINFRTGQVKSSRGNPTLYEIFRSNYEKRGLPEAEIQEKLNSIFVKNEEGNYVFSDYSNHTMKMFYMERGAGASNLHMRFNLAAVKPGTVELSKKLSGTENPSNSLIEFPYQIWYKSPTLFGNEDYHRLGEQDGDPERVTYKDTITQVKYEESFTPSGGTVPYENVFFLKAGQTAVIDLPESTMDYYIVECGIDPGVYDHVYVNTSAQDEHEVVGEPTENHVGERARRDYSTEPDTVKDRPKVDYVNHVNDDAVRTLTINKWLYDTNGQDRLHYPDNQTEFTFRLYLGSENDDPDKLPLANMYEYHVKDPYGNYCTWSSDDQKFVSLDKTEYSALTDEEKELAKFTTSMYGAISRIPADFTVEVRDLIAGLQYKVEERQNQIPKGYTLRQIDGYERIDEDHYINNKDVPISGVMQANQDPAIRVNNQKGWGLSVEKKWTDADFMEMHDPIYFAVYLKDEQSETGIADEPVEGTIRQLTTDKTSVYYYFDHLEQGRKFEDYVIREVIVKPPLLGRIVVTDGVVTSYGTVTPIDDGGKLNIGGKRIGGEYQRDGFEYTVSYKVGEPTLLNENVRTDTVTNSMPGIELYKTDWEGKPLAGAVFTLKDQDGKDVAAESYTSGEDGLITTAYLPVGTYTLEETAAPNGYMTLDGPATITVSEDEEGKTTVEISDIDESMYDIDTDGSAMAATIHIKNRTPSLAVKKYDASDKEPIKGVHFALYLQVTDAEGKKVKDYQPINGYEDIFTDESGVLPGLTMKLGRNTYYLTEKQPQEGYDPLPGDLCFTIGADGKFRIVTSEEEGADPAWAAAGIDPSSWLKIDPSSAPADADGKVSYTLEIPNSKEKKVSFKKVDIANIEQPLKGAEFDLYETVDGQRKETPLIAGLVSGEDGMLADEKGKTVFGLTAGIYHLVETKAPDGYNLKTEAVVIELGSGNGSNTGAGSGVSYSEGTNLSSNGNGISYNEETEVYTFLISDTAGQELPHTGGPGTTVIYLAGIMLIALSLFGLSVHRKKSE